MILIYIYETTFFIYKGCNISKHWLLGADLISNFRVRGVRQNSHLKQAKLGTFEYSGVNQAITVWSVKK